jgi:hypothetical protein
VSFGTPVQAAIFTGTLCGQFEALVAFNAIIGLASRSGEVSLTAEALSERTGIPKDVLATGLARLASPDAKSRAQVEDGRRIVPLEGGAGWRVVGWPRTAEFDCRPIALRLPVNEWRLVRRAIFERDDFTCAYCGTRGGKLECDHIIPVSRGGGHDFENLATACFQCNRSKRARLVSEWIRA